MAMCEKCSNPYIKKFSRSAKDVGFEIVKTVVSLPVYDQNDALAVAVYILTEDSPIAKQLKEKAESEINQEKILKNSDIFNIWRYGYCRCGGKKYERTAFCYDCFGQLTTPVKGALSKKMDIAFYSQFRLACAELDGVVEA